MENWIWKKVCCLSTYCQKLEERQKVLREAKKEIEEFLCKKIIEAIKLHY